MWCLHGHKYPFSYQVAAVLFSVPIEVRRRHFGKWGVVEPERGAGEGEGEPPHGPGQWEGEGRVNRR